MDTSDILQNKIDFCGIIIAERCNPNGDPVNSNVPRQDFSGHGFITDVCLKRKIRNYLYENGHDIFVVTQTNLKDGHKSLQSITKADSDLSDALKAKDSKRYLAEACKKWLDVRAFGQVFAFKQRGVGISEFVRGPVTIQDAVSLDYVDIICKDLTKSVNSTEADPKSKKSKSKNTELENDETENFESLNFDSAKSSDRMGRKYQIDHGAYVFRGSIFPQLAKATGFTLNDAIAIRDAIINMFQNDASSARPSGSMVLDKLYWWTHSCPNGQYSPSKVFRSLTLEPAVEYPYYTATLNELPDLTVEVFDGW